MNLLITCHRIDLSTKRMSVGQLYKGSGRRWELKIDLRGVSKDLQRHLKEEASAKKRDEACKRC